MAAPVYSPTNSIGRFHFAYILSNICRSFGRLFVDSCSHRCEVIPHCGFYLHFSWWWTGRPGMLLSLGLQRVGHDWMTELNWIISDIEHLLMCLLACMSVCLLWKNVCSSLLPIFWWDCSFSSELYKALSSIYTVEAEEGREKGTSWEWCRGSRGLRAARLSQGGSDRGSLRGSGAGVEEDIHGDRSHCPEILRTCTERRTKGGELCSNANNF